MFILLVLLQAPPAPLNFRVTHVASRSLTFRWDLPDNPNGILTQYRLTLTSWYGSDRVIGNGTSQEYHTLHPFTNYTASIVLVTITEGEAATLSVMTLEDSKFTYNIHFAFNSLL